MTADGAADGTTYHAASNTDLSSVFIPVVGSEQVAAGGSVTITLTVDPVTVPKSFFRIIEGVIP